MNSQSHKGVVCICLSVILTLTVSLPAFSDAPSTQSAATQPENELAADAPVRKWFDQLADVDPKIREQARVDLMGIPQSDLPKLRQLVIDQKPLIPAKAAVLHDIVIQSYLAAAPYELDNTGMSGAYFVGIAWVPAVDQDEARLGVPVGERLPGFPSFRYLHAGDMIQGVYVNPNAPLAQLPNMETHSVFALTSVIRTAVTSDIVLQILRDGESIRVPITMARRPMAPNAVENFNSQRIVEAEEYWQQNFAPLVNDEIAASNLTEAP